MRYGAIALVLGLGFLGGSPLAAQNVWDSPLLIGPGSPGGISLFLIDPGEGLGAMGRWHGTGASSRVGFRAGVAETHADEIVDIADETPETKEVKDKEGNVIDITLDSAFIQWQRQRIESRKWNAAKQRPRKYGDRVTHAGDDENPVVVENNHNVFGELLKAIKLERQAKAYGDK